MKNELDKLDAKINELIGLKKFKEAIACYDELFDILVKEDGIKESDTQKIRREYLEGIKKNPFYQPTNEALIVAFYDSKKALIRYTLARSFFEEEKFEEALEWFNSVLEIFSKDYMYFRNSLKPKQNAPELYEVLVKKGHTLRELGDYEEALTCYDSALKINPKYHEAYLRKGDVLYDLRRDEESIATYDQGLKIKPISSRGIMTKLCGGKSYVLAQHGRYEESIACHELALMYDPDNANIYASKIEALYNLGKNEEVCLTFDKLFNRIPNFTGTINHIDIYYDKILETNPNNEDILYQKGKYLNERGEFEEAVVTFNKLLLINPDHYGALTDKKRAMQELDKSR